MSSTAATAPMSLGRISGFRGLRGEVTLRVASGHAERWVHLRRALVDGAPRTIASARAYRDRLVLKFAGVDNPSQADALKGCDVSVQASDLPTLPEGEIWTQRLVGLRVVESGGAPVGLVEDVVETGGTDILLVRGPGGEEILVPLARAIVLGIDLPRGVVEVALPDGLRDLNAPGEEAR